MGQFHKTVLTVMSILFFFIFAGCGGGDSPKTESQITPVAATVSSDGTSATFNEPIPVKSTSGSIVTSLSAGTVITVTSGKLASVQTVSVIITTPVNGTTSGVPTVLNGGTTFALTSAAGAVDISIPGVDTFTVAGAGLTINIPVANIAGLVDGQNNVRVTGIKSNGTVREYTDGVFNAATKMVTLSGVTDFCWFVANPNWISPTGSTGSFGNSF